MAVVSQEKPMPIIIDVKPDLSRFVQAGQEELAEFLTDRSYPDRAHELAAELLERYVLLPR